MEQPDPTALARASSYGGALIAAVACEWKRRPAAVALLDVGIALANTSRMNGRVFAPWNDVSFERDANQPGIWTVTFYGSREVVRCLDPGEFERFTRVVQERREQRDQAKVAAADPFRLAANDRGLRNNLYLGGANTPLWPEANVSLVFRSDRIEVWPAGASAPTHEHLLERGAQLSISGPGKVTTGGRFIGGGSGLIGVAEGIAIASLLNRITSRTTISTIVTITDHDSEAFFLQAGVEPHELRMHLSPFFVAQRRHDRSPPQPTILGTRQPELAAGDPTLTAHDAVEAETVEVAPAGRTPPATGLSGSDMVEQLKTLADMRRAGDLTDDEYTAAKQTLLGR